MAVPYFPQTLPANTLVGRLGSTGPTEAIPLSTLAAAVLDIASVTLDTRALIAATEIDATINTLRTSGYTSPGDGGGGLYVRAVSEPAHDGKVQSDDGAWWELVLEFGTCAVQQFGGFPNTASDSYAAITAAIGFCKARGKGKVHLSEGAWRTTLTIVVDASHVKLEGLGGGTSHDVGSLQVAATRLQWYGATGAGEVVVRIGSPFGSAATQVQVDQAIQGIAIDCRALAGVGVAVVSARNCTLRDLFVLDPTSIGYRFTCGVSGTNFGEACDNHGCIFERLFVRALDSVAVQSAAGFYIDGSTNANTCFSQFISCQAQTFNGHAWDLVNCDTVVFISCKGTALGTGRDWFIRGSVTATTVGGAACIFIACAWSSVSGQFHIAGTDQFDGATTDTMILALDEANSAAMPTLGTGADYISPTRTRAALAVKGAGTNSSTRVRDIIATGDARDMPLHVNAAGTALEWAPLLLTSLRAAVAGWTDWTPAYTSAGGTLGTAAASKARWIKIGDIVIAYWHMAITTAGSSPTGALISTLPYNVVSNAGGVVVGYDLNTGNFIGGYVTGASQRALMTFYGGATATGNGTTIIGLMIYEAGAP